jgi:hypothetical protein
MLYVLQFKTWEQGGLTHKHGESGIMKNVVFLFLYIGAK